MRSLLVAGAILLLTPVAAEATVRYQGFFQISASAGTCANDHVGSSGRARFRPANVDGNGPSTTLSMVSRRSAMSFRVPGAITGSAKTAELMGIGDGFGEPEVAPTIRWQRTVSFNSKPKFVTATAIVENYDDTPGCRVTVQIGLIRRAD